MTEVQLLGIGFVFTIATTIIYNVLKTKLKTEETPRRKAARIRLAKRHAKNMEEAVERWTFTWNDGNITNASSDLSSFIGNGLFNNILKNNNKELIVKLGQLRLTVEKIAVTNQSRVSVGLIAGGNNVSELKDIVIKFTDNNWVVLTFNNAEEAQLILKQLARYAHQDCPI